MGQQGGSQKQWFSDFYKAKKEGAQAVKQFLENNPHPKKSSK